MEKKTLVIFDVDDTLLDSMSMDSRAFADTFESMYDSALPTIDWSTYPHVTDTTIFNVAFERVHERMPSAEEVDLFRNRFVERMMHKRSTDPMSFKAIPGALEVFNFLREHEDYLVGVATGGWMLPAQSKLAYRDFDLNGVHDSYADGKVTREEILSASVSSAKVEYANLRPVYLGDALWDIRTTRNMNMDFIGIRHRGDVEVLENQGATQVISDYRNVQGFLQMIDQATPPLSV